MTAEPLPLPADLTHETSFINLKSMFAWQASGPWLLTPPDNVRYLGQFGEHILTESFTARDPKPSLLAPA